MAGLTQAGILLVIVRAAAAVTVGTESFDASVGPLSVGELSTTTLLWIGLALIVVYFAVELVAGWSMARMGSTASQALRGHILRRYSTAEWPAKTATDGSSLVQLVTANSSQAVNSLVLAAQLLKYTGIFVTLVSSSFVISPVGAVFMMIAMGGLFLLTLPLVRATRRQNRYATELNKAFAKEVQEVTQVGREIQVFGVTAESLDRAQGINKRHARLQLRNRLVNQISGTVFRVAALALILGSLAVLNVIGSGNAASMAAALLILLRSVSAGQAVQGNLQNFSETVPWIDQIRTGLDRLAVRTMDRAEPVAFREQAALGPVAISIKGLDFGYVPGEPVLTDVDLEIRAGESIGVIGRSGAGKTTLGELLLGLWDPIEGTITVDGDDLSGIARQDWAMRVAYVPQDPVLVTGTVAHNIGFFRHWVDRAAIERAADDALLTRGGAAAEFGLDIPISGGRGVSGGQRQRVAIARALAGRPGLIVLDEPTSALDVQSESIIAETLDRLQGTTTMVIIAHRLSTLQHCDRILVLERGRVVAFDDPSRLGDLHRYLETSGEA